MATPTKKESRIRRARKSRAIIRRKEINRLQVHRTNRHIYAQVISPQNVVLVATSTLAKEVGAKVKYPGNVESAKLVGEQIAKLAKANGVAKVAFDRSGFSYHGRIKALADQARENGLEF